MTRRRAIIATLVLAALSIGAVSWWPDDPPSSSSSEPAPEDRIDAPRVTSADPLDAPGQEPVAQPAIAPTSARDAGKGSDLMNAWRAALAADLEAAALRARSAGGSALPPTADGGLVRGAPRSSSEAKGNDDVSLAQGDAGSQLACDPGPVRISMQQRRVDLVVAIDTSGSMVSRMPRVNSWLIQKLEPSLRKASIDYQLIAVVDLEMVRRMVQRRGGKDPIWAPDDAGYHIGKDVQSHDVLEVLVAAGGTSGSSWLTRLRPDSDVHLVIVTDDDPFRGATAAFIGKVTALAGGRLGTQTAPAFQIHGILGLATAAPQWVLPPEALPTYGVCAVKPGAEYQELIRSTGGLRGSVCHRESLDAFTDQLIAGLNPGQTMCEVPLPANFPVGRLTSIRAIGRGGSERRLDQVFDCEFGREGYLLAGHRLTVCPASCRALTAGGFEMIEAVGTCSH